MRVVSPVFVSTEATMTESVRTSKRSLPASEPTRRKLTRSCRLNAFSFALWPPPFLMKIEPKASCVTVTYRTASAAGSVTARHMSAVKPLKTVSPRRDHAVMCVVRAVSTIENSHSRIAPIVTARAILRPFAVSTFAAPVMSPPPTSTTANVRSASNVNAASRMPRRRRRVHTSPSPGNSVLRKVNDKLRRNDARRR